MLSSRDIEEVLQLTEGLPPTRRGGNSTITRVSWRDLDLAVKDYSARVDAGDRLRRETRGLRFLEQAGVHGFPRCIGVAPQRKLAVFTWVEGEPPPLDHASVSAMTDVLERLDGASRAESAQGVESAADAIVALSDIADQVRHRCTSLSASPVKSVAVYAHDLSSAMNRISSRHEPGGRCPTLSLSDFGCHNMLRDINSGEHAFLDLEFFGWDDAHKLVVDTLLHPLASWSDSLSAEFLDSSRELYRLDDSRLIGLTSLLSGKWAAIVAARAEREALAGDMTACDRSLERARIYLGLAIGSECTGWMSALMDGGSR